MLVSEELLNSQGELSSIELISYTLGLLKIY